MTKSENKAVITTAKNTSQREKERAYAIKQLGIKVVEIKDNDNFFENIIGNERVKNFFSSLVDIFSNPDSYDISLINKKFLLIGETGVGKALMTYAFANELGIPIVCIDIEKLVNCPPNIAFTEISKVINEKAPCVVFFKELDYLGVLEDEKALNYCSNIIAICQKYEDCYFFTSTSAGLEIFQFFIEQGAFDTRVVFELPDPSERELLIQKFIKKLNIKCDENLDFKKVAKDFFGLSAGDIENILKKSYIKSMIAKEETLTYRTINDTLYAESFGDKRHKMSEEELKMTAYHEAGHVIAGFYSDPNYKVSKVEIASRDESLGLTEQENDEEKRSYTKEDICNVIISNFGGKVAEDVIFSTTTSGVAQDLATATQFANMYVKNFGMDENFGPVCLASGILESAILDDEADKKIQELLKSLYKKCELIVTEHKSKLIELAEELLVKETLYKEDVEKILNE